MPISFYVYAQALTCEARAIADDSAAYESADLTYDCDDCNHGVVSPGLIREESREEILTAM